MNRTILIIAAVVALAAAFGVWQMQDGDSSDTSETKVFASPAFDAEQGTVEITSYDVSTVTYTAKPNAGFQWSHWEDMDGNLLSYCTSYTFDAKKDRAAEAVFEPEGVHTSHLVWKVPVFGDDGTVSDGATARLDLTFDTSEYKRSLADAGIQRVGTGAQMWPGTLCSASGAMADVVSYMEFYTEGQTDLQKAITVLSFVQDAIGYQSDIEQYGKEEFWATPAEVLYSGYGDCEDTATLYASIASALGLDVGFVKFDSNRYGDDGTGHMSVAVALKGTESVKGGATFEMDGAVWAYGETAFDMGADGYRPVVGVISDSYDIDQGRFSRVSYADGQWSIGKTERIGKTVSPSGIVIYGADASEPGAIKMDVGDRFSYRPQITVSGTITASGDGLSWLTWDASTGTLSGIPTVAGTYHVVLTAVSADGPEQRISQTLTFIVSDPSQGGDGAYADDADASDGKGSDGGMSTGLKVVIAAVCILAVLFVAKRFI